MDDIDGYDKMVSVLTFIGSYTYAPRKLGSDLKNCATLPAKHSI